MAGDQEETEREDEGTVVDVRLPPVVFVDADVAGVAPTDQGGETEGTDNA